MKGFAPAESIKVCNEIVEVVGNGDVHFTVSRVVIRIHKSAGCLLEDPHRTQPRRITFKNTMESFERFFEMLDRYQSVLNDVFLIVILLDPVTLGEPQKRNLGR